MAPLAQASIIKDFPFSTKLQRHIKRLEPRRTFWPQQRQRHTKAWSAFYNGPFVNSCNFFILLYSTHINQEPLINN